MYLWYVYVVLSTTTSNWINKKPTWNKMQLNEKWKEDFLTYQLERLNADVYLINQCPVVKHNYCFDIIVQTIWHKGETGTENTEHFDYTEHFYTLDHYYRNYRTELKPPKEFCKHRKQLWCTESYQQHRISFDMCFFAKLFRWFSVPVCPLIWHVKFRLLHIAFIYSEWP